jgi:hypothetical protein
MRRGRCGQKHFATFFSTRDYSGVKQTQMKRCTYCGKEYTDEISECIIDGQPLAPLFPVSSPKGRASDQTSGDFHDEVKTVTIRIFSNHDSAQIARSNLEAHGIECWIKADDCGGLYSNLAAANGVRLLVHALEAKAAIAILDPQSLAENLTEENDGIVKSDEIVRDRPKFIIIVGIWMIYGVGLCMNIIVIKAVVSDRIARPLGLIYFWLSIGCGAFCSYMLYRVVRNYIIHKRRSQDRL